MTYVITLIYGIFVFIQAKSLLKQKKKAELAVSLALMLIALAYSYDALFELNLPKPGMLLDFLFEGVSQSFFGTEHK